MKNKLYFLFSLFIFLHSFAFAETKRILVGSPVRQKPAILEEFLASLKRQEQNGYQLDYYFVDDNDNVESSQKLEMFSKECGSKCILVKPQNQIQETYVCNEVTHFWKDALIWKVAAFKDDIIDYAVENNYDYLFLIDSDIVLHPNTIGHLKNQNKDILSNIFWTAWSLGCMEQPQVWLFDEYTQHQVIPGLKPTDDEIKAQVYEFYAKLRVPGVYEVGGLGACTLISKHALQKGVNFKKISNLTFWGEDRHFCIRATALGLQLFVDTHYPSYHIYREANLSGVDAFVKACEKEKLPKITLSMIVHNEADKYLRRVLEAAKPYISNAVIIDDASSDNTAAVCEEVLAGIPLHLVKNEKSMFTNEVELRKLQFAETIKTDPEWILVLDADEIFENKFKDEIQNLLSQKDVDVYYFKLYDFWDEEHYRDDQYWSAHHHYRPFLIRYKPDVDYVWKETTQHCGRFPLNIYNMAYKASELRLKHFGWAKKENRIAKYTRYQQLDPDARYGWKEQYDSILDEHPNLVKWIE
ncbi:MAG TPA: glycosyltransferase [Parachlamydiaceae bacterium]|nr:glycosyltransferase [Parachlamydiaceae bacterium]